MVSVRPLPGARAQAEAEAEAEAVLRCAGRAARAIVGRGGPVPAWVRAGTSATIATAAATATTVPVSLRPVATTAHYHGVSDAITAPGPR